MDFDVLEYYEPNLLAWLYIDNVENYVWKEKQSIFVEWALRDKPKVFFKIII